MEGMLSGIIGYGASLLTIVILYPYRDYTKSFSSRGPFIPANPIDFCMARYRGMLQNPVQPLLLAGPWGALYFGFCCLGGGFPGAVLGGLLHATGKVFVATTARRLRVTETTWRGSTGPSLVQCLRQGTKQYGVYSWVSGVTATAIASTCWHGFALTALQWRVGELRRGSDFLANWWTAFRTHAFLVFLTAPIRNSFRSALYNCERAGGVRTVRCFLRGEAVVFREAVGVARSMIRTEGIPFFFYGSLRVTCKTSVPFGFTYALFRAFGGSLGSRRGGNTDAYMNRSPAVMRRLSSSFRS